MQNESEIENIIQTLSREIAMIVDLPESEIQPDTPLADLGLDSIRLMEIIIFVEKNYGINLVDKGLTKDALQNLGALAEVIAAHQ